MTSTRPAQIGHVHCMRISCIVSRCRHLFIGNAVLQLILEDHEPGRVGLAVQEAVIEFLDLILV